MWKRDGTTQFSTLPGTLARLTISCLRFRSFSKARTMANRTAYSKTKIVILTHLSLSSNGNPCHCVALCNTQQPSCHASRVTSPSLMSSAKRSMRTTRHGRHFRSRPCQYLEARNPPSLLQPTPFTKRSFLLTSFVSFSATALLSHSFSFSYFSTPLYLF